MQKIREYLQKQFGAEHRTKWILLLGFIGMAMILFSGFLPDKKKSDLVKQQQTDAETVDADAYRLAMETQLTDLLSKMEGVGQVTVMLTVIGSGEQVYAEEVKADKTNNGVKTQSAFVITRNDGKESALLSESRYPAIQGAAILCTGGGHAAVQERVSHAVATVLGIPASRIFVGQGISE